MPSFRTGAVVRELAAREGLQRIEVDLGDGPERAYVLTQLTGAVTPGDRVVVNTTAVELGLGTGGWHVVHWNLSRETWSEQGPGHILKARYTSLQTDVGSAEEHFDSELATVDSINGLQAGVPGLEDVAGPLLAPGLTGQVPVDDMPSAGAEPELDRGGVHHDSVAGRDRAGQLGQDVGPFRTVAEIHLDALEPLTRRELAHHRAGPK